MLCCVPVVQETYENNKLLFDITQLNKIPFKFFSDFKIILIVNGKQTATSKYPSPYCFITLNKLREMSDNPSKCYNKYEKCLKLLTYGDLKQTYNRIKQYGEDKKYAKECQSCIHQPLFEEEDNIYVIEKSVPPELHLLQGFVNHLFWDGIVPLLGRENVLIWGKKIKLVSKTGQGEIFEGNACRKLIETADNLLDPQILGTKSDFEIIPFISTFKALNKIVRDAFSYSKPSSDLDKYIIDLRKCFQATGVTETLKIHVVLYHIKDAFPFLNNSRLGLWSEQACESIDREFIKFWNKYIINIIEDVSYGVRFKRAVVYFSSSHL